jgi:hypothetical protein
MAEISYEEYRKLYPNSPTKEDYNDYIESRENQPKDSMEARRSYLESQTGLLDSVTSLPGSVTSIFSETPKDTIDPITGETREFRQRDVVTKMKEGQSISALPTFKLGINNLVEYDAAGNPDYALDAIPFVGGFGTKETDIINIGEEGLNATGLEKLKQGINEFQITDFKPEYIADKGSLVLKDDGTYRNSAFGGILPKGVVFGESGLLSSRAGAPATVTGSGAIQPTPDVSQVLSNLSMAGTGAGTATAGMDLAGMESMAGLLGKVMMMRGLLDNSSQNPMAAAPRGAPGLNLQRQDLYKRYRG